MRDLLPQHLVDFLRDRYIAGVATAEAHFADSNADEDSVTGALGQAISMHEPLIFGDQSGNFSVQVSYRKLRGRGLNAPERLYGSDGIFQVAVTTEEGVVVRLKGLPFQSKINWEGRSASVASQSEDIEASTGEGIVVDYTTTGYRACSTGVVVEARGNRNEVERRGGMKPLGQLLGVDFLECRIGKIGLFFDPETERYFKGDNMVEPRHAITTRVVARRRAV